MTSRINVVEPPKGSYDVKEEIVKPMVVMLCAVLWCVSMVVAQESDWLSGTWKGIRKLEPSAHQNIRQREAANSAGVATMLHLQYNPATKVITGQGEAQNLRLANSNFTETVLDGSFFDGNKGVLILQQHGGVTDGAVRKYSMERDQEGSLSGYSQIGNAYITLKLKKQ